MGDRVNFVDELANELIVYVSQFLDIISYLRFLYSNAKTMFVLGGGVEAIRFRDKFTKQLKIERQELGVSRVGNDFLTFLIRFQTLDVLRYHLTVANSDRVRLTFAPFEETAESEGVLESEESLWNYDLASHPYLSRVEGDEVLRWVISMDSDSRETARRILVRLLSGGYRVSTGRGARRFEFLRLLHETTGVTSGRNVIVSDLPVYFSGMDSRLSLLDYVFAIVVLFGWTNKSGQKYVFELMLRDFSEMVVQDFGNSASNSTTTSSTTTSTSALSTSNQLDDVTLVRQQLSNVARKIFVVFLLSTGRIEMVKAGMVLEDIWPRIFDTVELSSPPTPEELISNRVLREEFAIRFLALSSNSAEQVRFVMKHAFGQFAHGRKTVDAFAFGADVATIVYERFVELGYLSLEAKRKYLQRLVHILLNTFVTNGEFGEIAMLMSLGWIGPKLELGESFVAGGMPVADKEYRVLLDGGVYMHKLLLFSANLTTLRNVLSLLPADTISSLDVRVPKRPEMYKLRRFSPMPASVLVAWAETYGRKANFASYFADIMKFSVQSSKKVASLDAVLLWLKGTDYSKFKAEMANRIANTFSVIKKSTLLAMFYLMRDDIPVQDAFDKENSKRQKTSPTRVEGLEFLACAWNSSRCMGLHRVADGLDRVVSRVKGMGLEYGDLLSAAYQSFWTSLPDWQPDDRLVFDLYTQANVNAAVEQAFATIQQVRSDDNDNGGEGPSSAGVE